MLKFAIAAAVFVAAAIFLLIPFVKAEPPQAAPASQDLIKRGEFLVNFGGCHDCHTPKKMGEKGPEPDMSRSLMGHPADVPVAEIPQGLAPDKWMAVTNFHLSAWGGPWGVSFAANITPDKETGIGTWSETMFIKAMRTGKHLGEGRDILPPMPWQAIALASDEDLKAIFAYLHSVKPVHNPVPDPVPPAAH